MKAECNNKDVKFRNVPLGKELHCCIYILLTLYHYILVVTEEDLHIANAFFGHYASCNMERSYENEIRDIMQPQFKGQLFTDKLNLL